MHLCSSDDPSQVLSILIVHFFFNCSCQRIWCIHANILFVYWSAVRSTELGDFIFLNFSFNGKILKKKRKTFFWGAFLRYLSAQQPFKAKMRIHNCFYSSVRQIVLHAAAFINPSCVLHDSPFMALTQCFNLQNCDKSWKMLFISDPKNTIV